jgi:signal transduction histidine kinase
MNGGRRWTRTRRLLADDVALRRVSYALAGVIGLLSASTVLGGSPLFGSEVVLVPAGVLALASLRFVPWRPALLSVAAGIVAAAIPDAENLWPVAAVLVFFAVADDPADTPWLGWAGGLAGAGASLVIYSYAPSVAPFIAVLIGGGAATLLRSRLRAAVLTQEATELRDQAQWREQRTNLARELHDVVGHHVTAMVVQAEAGLVSDPSKALTAIGGLGRRALSELDALVVHLRDPESTFTLSAPPRLSDIDELLAGALRSGGVDVSVRVDPDLGLDEVGVLTVYRVTQEALTNVARHARARAAWVDVTRVGDRVVVRVADDGVGPPAEPTRGSGLLGIEERVAAAGGAWRLGERPGGGTVVDVLIPAGTA